MMDFFKKKRKADQEHKDETKEIEPASKRSRVVSLVKKVGENIRSKIVLAVKTLTSKSYSHPIPSKLFTTPAGPLRSARYVMTPLEPFSVKRSAIEWRKNSYFVLDSVMPVTESHRHEFKTGGGRYPITILPEHVRKYGCAFLNSSGGVLMAGVLDDGRIHGIRCSPHMMRDMTQTVESEFARFLPNVPPDLFRVQFVPVIFKQTGTEKKQNQITYVRDVYVLELTVKAGEEDQIYETGRHEVYVRRESSVQGPLNPLQIKDIVLSKYRKKIERRRIEKLQQITETPKATDTLEKRASKEATPNPVREKQVIIVSP
ncbi:schlafen-like protein 1 [Montipora foliosa]